MFLHISYHLMTEPRVATPPPAGDVAGASQEEPSTQGASTQSTPQLEAVVTDAPDYIHTSPEDWLEMDKLVDLDCLDWDVDLRWGQIRRLDQDILEQVRAQFNQQPPSAPLRVLLVAKDISGLSSYSVFHSSVMFRFQPNGT